VPVVLEFKNITYKIDNPGGGKRTLLNNISGMVKPGRLLAIMGPTGSGKTTLLTALSGRIPSLEKESVILVNNKPPTKDYKRQVAFVLQDDVLFDNLTVEQTLYYTACLRLGDMTQEETMASVDRVIDFLNLHKARHTHIGGAFKRGVSGGERKRVNIGNELLTQPSILLLDEPTSGLDTSTGINLLQLLKGLSEVGLTVITTIHQPSSQMFSLFDDLLILVDGNVTYYGPANKTIDYYSSIGFHCTKFFNPADFIMGLILEEEISKQEGASMKDRLIESWKAHPVEEMSEDDKKLVMEFQEIQEKRGTPSYSNSFFSQVSILFRRSWYQSKKDVFNVNDFVQILFIALFVSVLWWQQPESLDYFTDRIGVIFFVASYVGLFWPAFKGLLTFPSERAVILRERTSGSYRLSAYFLAKSLNELPFMWEIPLILIIIIYFTVGLKLTPAAFFIFLGISLLSAWTSSSLGLAISAVSGPDLARGLTTMTIVTMVIFLSGGFFVTHYPTWIQWLTYLTYLKFVIDAYVINEFTGTTWAVKSTCGLPGNLSSLNATEISGDTILENYNLYIDSIGLNVLVILGYGLLFRIIALIALQISMQIPKTKKKKDKKKSCK
jgi:ABC-type multidrug transport system ATPase subunit/ABC-type multidrug transport system permease subunit